jgi:hypothetical protein
MLDFAGRFGHARPVARHPIAFLSVAGLAACAGAPQPRGLDPAKVDSRFAELARETARPGPRWAQQPDAADKSGHTFVCEGAGQDEGSALATAYGVCNDKICKVCGVEVESVLRTKETLRGVSMERQVVERCRRVRKHEPTVRAKSVDCEPSGCRAWVQVFYAKADEEAECPRYAAEKFADPARCEQDIDDFMQVQGRTAQAFRQRREAIDRALDDCTDIDVRPTPALTAIETKLHKGLDNFESAAVVTGGRGLPDWAYYTHAAPGWRDELRMTKTLAARLQKIRNVVHDRFLVFTVLEAAKAPDLGSPAGISRLLAAMRQSPPGARFGALDDVNLEALSRLGRVKADTTAIGDFFRQAYPPESLTRLGYTETLSTDNVRRVAAFFGSDGKVTAAEWEYALRIPEIAERWGSLPMLVHAPDHGGDEIRMKRILAAYDLVLGRPVGGAARAAALVLPDFDEKDPEFLLRIEGKLPAKMRLWYDARTFETVARAALRGKVAADLQARVDARYLKAFAAEPATEERDDYCQHLTQRIKDLEKRGVSAQAAYQRMCWCVNDPTHSNKGLEELLLERAMAQGISCRCPIDAKQTRTSLVFDWKKGQTPRDYGPFAERKVTFTLDVDPKWHACVAAHRSRDASLSVYFYGGATEDEARESKRSLVEDVLRLSSPHDTLSFEGRHLCNRKPAFVAYELRGRLDLAIFNGKRTVVPIPCE